MSCSLTLVSTEWRWAGKQGFKAFCLKQEAAVAKGNANERDETKLK